MKKNFIKFLKEYIYIIFLSFAFCYFVIYSVYHFSSRVHEFFKDYDIILKYFADISIFFFTAVVFSASIKYFQFLGVFKDEFQKVILSEQFDNKLEKHLTQITFSEDFLLKQNNLHDIWTKVTLCMYKQQFPEIHLKLKNKITNHFYLNKNISHYYKNFQTNFHISLDGPNHVIIVQNSSYTVIRPTVEEFPWDFSLSYLDEPENNGELSFKIINMGNRVSTDGDIVTEIKGDTKIMTARCDLKGRHEYYVERTIKLRQNLNTDRIFSFSTDRIIDDLSFQIKHCDKLGVFLSEVDKNKFYKNGAFGSESLSYINRDIFLPGEKFKIFIFRQNT